MDGTLLLDVKHRGVHHKKCFPTVTWPFWKEPENLVNRVEARSQLQEKKVFFEKIKNKYFKYLLTKKH